MQQQSTVAYVSPPVYKFLLVAWIKIKTVACIYRVTVTQFLHTVSVPAVFPPWCRTSSEKCFLLWYHCFSKIVIPQTFSQTNWFNFIRITRQIFTT